MQQRKDHDSTIDQTRPVHLRHCRVVCPREEAEYECDPEEGKTPEVEEDSNGFGEGEGRR